MTTVCTRIAYSAGALSATGETRVGADASRCAIIRMEPSSLRPAGGLRLAAHAPPRWAPHFGLTWNSLMQFDSGPKKAKSNLKKHRVSLEEAVTVFLPSTDSHI